MIRRFVFIFVLLFCVAFCLPSQADEQKIVVALIDFADETPNKMAVTADEKTDSDRVHISKVMQVVRETIEKSGLFELMPNKEVSEAVNTRLGKEAAARRYDRFSAVRLGRILGVDAILTGEIVQFEKNYIPKDFTINGLDISKRIEDVVIRARLINAYNGEVLADATGAGNADENVLETISATIANRLSTGFLRAVSISSEQIIKKFESADIKIDKEYTAHSYRPEKREVAPGNFSIVKIEGNYIIINAGRNMNVSIADLFAVLKKDGDGNLKPTTVYSVSMVGADYSRLVQVNSKETDVKVVVGDKVQRKVRGTVMKIEAPKNEVETPQKSKTKQPRRPKKVK